MAVFDACAAPQQALRGPHCRGKAGWATGQAGARLGSSPRGTPLGSEGSEQQPQMLLVLRTFGGASTQLPADSAQVMGQAQHLISGTPSPSASLPLPPPPSRPSLTPEDLFFLGWSRERGCGVYPSCLLISALKTSLFSSPNPDIAPSLPNPLPEATSTKEPNFNSEIVGSGEAQQRKCRCKTALDV